MRKKIFFTLTLSLFVCLAALLMFNCGGTSETSAGSTASIFAISGVNLWDGAGNAPIRDSVIVVSDSRIQAVGPRASTPIPKGATVISGEGKTLIPGLINAHGHVGMTKGLKAGPENYSEENVLAQLRQYARYGVTTVQSLGTDFEPMFKLRGPAKADEAPRATVFTAGRGFTGTQGYPAVLPGNAGVPREVDAVEEVRYATPPAFLDDPFFNRWIDPEIIKQLKDPAYGARIKADPDFSKFPGQLAMAKKNLKKLWDAGVHIAFGSDTGPPARFQGFFEHRELELMVEAGLTPAQALQAATSNTATALRISGDFGALAKGKRADMILLDADPLADIRNTRKINKVWVGGREVN